MTRHLTVIPGDQRSAPAPSGEPPAARIQRLQKEARDLARGHVIALAEALGEVGRLADEIAGGGDVYPVGARELSRRLAEDAAHQALTLTAIVGRSAP